MDEEKWIRAYHPVTGEQYPHVLISSEGRIWLEERYVKRKDGHQQRAKVGYAKLGAPKGYPLFNHVRVSRIAVASQRKGKIPQDMVVHHKDNNPLNNSFANLELITQHENMQPERVKRTKPRGGFPADCKVAEAAVDLPGEFWRPITWYDNDNYAASNLGRIKNVGKNTIKKKSQNGAGYEIVTLCHKGKSKTFHVGRLIYQAFCGPIPEKFEVNHIDHVKTNNHIDNLEAVSSAANKIAAWDHGQHSHTRGDRVRLVNLIEQRKSDDEIARITNYSLSTISQVRREVCGITYRQMMTPDKHVDIIEDAKRGVPVSETSQRLGICQRTIIKIRGDNGLSRYKFASDEQLEAIRLMLLDTSLSKAEIARRAGKSPARITQLDAKWGIRNKRSA